ncbi:MAG: hypothetical protein BRD55_10785 [Bacteroidetes bacterium SW_9_63_38]|nr:MAG: hypothetical protein BRD55_10785 [Bacteroidetes bacterium SW_9_63_38]
MGRWLVLLVGVAVIVGCADSGSSDPSGASSTAMSDTAAARPAFSIRSVTVDARRRPNPELLVHLSELGVTHITLVAFGWQRAVDGPRVRIDTADGWYSESHRGIRALARQADTLGMEIILKPHLWVSGYDEAQDRSEIAFHRPAAWRQWARSYRRFLMVYARLAQQIDADLLVLGTELSQLSTTRPGYWRTLADTVRTVYDGDLTYAANWHEEYRKITFWDALDYVGVQAYFPLTENENPSLDTLRARWRGHRRALEDVRRRTEKPVLLTEIGYRSAPSAAAAPWRWPEQDGDVPPDSSLQARCYEAFLSTMSGVPWFAGAVIWKWHPAHDSDRPTGFTPQGKPAEAALRRWFRRPAPGGPTASVSGPAR